MTALLSGGWAGMGIIHDLERGVLDRFLVAPVPPAALVAGRLAAQAVITAIQSTIVVAVGLALGARVPGGVVGVAGLVAAAVALGGAIAALSIGLALVMRREERVVGAVQMLLMPLTFLSSVFMQPQLMPGWIADVARFNPADWAVRAGREAVAADVDPAVLASHGAALGGFALASVAAAAASLRAYRRSA